MRQLLALTAREILDRRSLVWASLFAAALPWAAYLFPGVGPTTAANITAALLALLAIAWPLGLALGLGASVIADDVAHARLSFYFSRPCPSLTIWGAKMCAAAVLSLGALVLLIAAGELGPRGAKLGEFLSVPAVGWLAAAILATIVVSNALAGAARARDGLFGWDLIVGLVLASLVVTLGVRLSSAGAFPVFRRLALWALGALTLATIAGGIAQVVVGRADARRGHLALSGIVWGTLAASLLAAAGFVHWALHPSPWDAGAVSWPASVSADGRIVSFMAPYDARRGFRPSFLLDLNTGTYRLDPVLYLWGAVQHISADGRVAASFGGSWRRPTLVVRRLDEPGWPASEASLDPGHTTLSEVSPDGRFLPVQVNGTLSLWDLDSMRVLSRLKVGQASWVFTAKRTLRVASSTGEGVRLEDLDVESGHRREVAAVQGATRAVDLTAEGGLFLLRNGDLVAWRPDGPQIVLARKAPARPGSIDWKLLSGARSVAVLHRAGGVHLVTWDETGHETADVPLPGELGPARLFGETRDGWLALGSHTAGQTLFVDVAAGRIQRHEKDLAPLGDPKAGLYVDHRGQIVRFDPATGSRNVVLAVHERDR